MEAPNLWSGGTEQQSNQTSKKQVVDLFSEKGRSQSRSLFWHCFLHLRAVCWHVNEGLCQISVLQGVEPLLYSPKGQHWASFIAEKIAFYYYFNDQVTLRIPGCLSEIKSSFYSTSKINMWVFVVVFFFFSAWTILVYFSKILMGWSTQDFVLVFWNLCLKACKRVSHLHTDCVSGSQMMLKSVKRQQVRVAWWDPNLHYSSDGTSDLSVGCFHLRELQSCHLDFIHSLFNCTTQI